VERQHTELARSPEYEYTINAGGFRDPTMKWVRIGLKGQGPEGDRVKYGYSDGPQTAAAEKPLRARYVWGQNPALRKPYTLQGAQDSRNPDGNHDLTDGVIAPPDTYVSAKYMPTNVMFAKDVSPVVTIDLGSPQLLSAARVHAGQESGFHLTYPDSITV